MKVRIAVLLLFMVCLKADYKVVLQERTWEVAKKECEKRGYWLAKVEKDDLALIGSEITQKYIQKGYNNTHIYSKAENETFWVGARQNKTKHWKWTDNSNVVEWHWINFKKNKKVKNKCGAVLYSGEMELKIGNCKKQKLPFICQNADVKQLEEFSARYSTEPPASIKAAADAASLSRSVLILSIFGGFCLCCALCSTYCYFYQ